MCPSDMTLVSLAERIAGYNNEILVETAAMSPGTNQTLNTRYDTRCYFNVRSKADISQLNLPHGTDN